MLRDIPDEERPRERMLRYGAGALSQTELLAILLRTGTHRESALHMAQRLLGEIGGIRGMMDLSLEELTNMKGIGPAKAVQIKAGIELGQRLAKARLPEARVIRSPRDAADLLMEELRFLQKEHFVCLFLNTKNHIIAQETLSIGSLNASIVHPREVFRAAIKCSSASLVCAHNHPSGDPTPSPEDIRMTRRLLEAGEIVGIDVLDHIVIGDGKFVSLKEQGLM
ncbi:DNA repair protein RadC [Paenibacillus sp. alder61]|uniref:JAB domain-containing protein n=1 Tax=Paenibacillus faecis TaxID=862114 RepID=A0A5D0CQQ7_9BACL|nr:MULTISPECIES: DNA repair protein RadC [Paenibacillus]MCA1295842.1 DNA repair protein RadC [Paenibacillus sp. alder61]TYA11107.1 JAB domain-containing protein [Paenibacillus faecis]